MRRVAFAVLLACGLAGCLRDPAPAADPTSAAPNRAPDSGVEPLAPARDAPAQLADGSDPAAPAELSIPPSWPGGDADYAADPLRCASLVHDAPREEGCDALPADVLAFLDRRASCEHWRGEPHAEPAELAAADPQARAELERRRDEIVRNASDECRGTDAALAALERRHAGDPALRDLLGAFEDRIEE